MIKTADVADNADTKGKVMILIRDRCGAPRAIRARSLSRARRDGPIWLRQCPRIPLAAFWLRRRWVRDRSCGQWAVIRN